MAALPACRRRAQIILCEWAAQQLESQANELRTTTVILVRHSRPEIDHAMESVRWHLSTEGRTKALLLAEQLARVAPDALYSSPEPKALETAEIVGGTLNLGVTVVPELREHDRTGVPFLARHGEFERSVLRFFAAPEERVFGTESAAEALRRFRTGIERVLSCRDREPAVVTHGTVMSLYLAAVSGGEAAAIWQELTMPCYVVVHDANRSVPVAIEHVAR